MGVLSQARALLFSKGSRLQTVKLAVDPLTSLLALRLRRPTSAQPLAWDADSMLKVSLVLSVDGIDYRCDGQASGGIRKKPDGTEAGEYTLSYRPPVLIRGGAVKRIGQTATQTIEAYAVLECVNGLIETELLDAVTAEAPPPDYLIKNSVAFDAASSANELNGDGILSLTHTAAGSDRAVFACSGNANSGATSSSFTYAGASMTEAWDLAASSYNNAGYYFVAPSTGAQTVTNTLSGSTLDHAIGVISLTGVDQSSPVGTPVTASGVGTVGSVTVATPGSSDMVLDCLYTSYADGSTPTVGANQTQRCAEAPAWLGSLLHASTQSGADGGVMSWSFGNRTYTLGAVNFQAATGVATERHQTRHMISAGGFF